MYEELVERLREPGKWIDAKEHYSLLKQAADAIEELMNISNSILSKYKTAVETVIWEYSGKISEDTDALLKEVDNYKSQINGDAAPPKEE